MLNAFWYPKLCRHNLPNPTCRPSLITGSYHAGAYLCSQVVPDLIVYQQYSLRASAWSSYVLNVWICSYQQNISMECSKHKLL